MTVSWDPIKAGENLLKHGVRFEDAVRIFALPEHIRFTIYDSEHSDAEDRWVTIGLLAQGTVVVVYTIRGEQDDDYRIISARFADRDEVRAYTTHLTGG